jgi:hypothetical protein
LPSKFFFRQIILLYFGKGILAGKNLLGKRVNLLCKEGKFSRISHQWKIKRKTIKDQEKSVKKL